MRIQLASGVTALLLLAAGAWHLGYSGGEEVPEPFPDKLPSRIELHPGETVRVVEYGDDTFQKVTGTAGYPDGAVAELDYHPNNEVREILSHFADGRLKQWAILQPDGNSFVMNLLFHENGQLKEYTHYIDETRFSIERYTMAGVPTLSLLQVLDESVWLVKDERRWDDDGVLRLSTHMDETGAFETKTFHRNARLASRITVDAQKSLYEEIVLLDDGATVYSTIKQTPEETLLTVYLDGGNYILRKWNRSIADSSLTVQFFGADGVMDYEQWLMPDGKGGYKLYSVRVFDETGKQTRLILFHQDVGGVSADVHLHAKEIYGPRTIYGYRKDGTLESVEEIGEKGAELSEEKFTVEEGIRPDVAAELLAWHEFTPPQQVITPAPPEMGP